MQDVAVAVWGFLVGFVGWKSCFLLPESIERRLLRIADEAVNLRALARLVIMLFLIFGVQLALLLPPIAFVAAGRVEPDPERWRTMMGIAFFASLGGFFVNGLMGRVGGSE